MTSRTTALLAGAAGFVFIIAASESQAATAPMQITAAITAECSIKNVTELAFGPLDNLIDNDATATFDISCSATSGVDVTLNEGSNSVNGTGRRLAHGTDANAFVPYLLYNGDPTLGDLWGPGTIKPYTVNAGADETVTVGGRVLQGTVGTTGGTYSDTVTINVVLTP